MQLQPSVRRALLLGVFVASGFTGLIYESIWSHYLKLFLGHAAYAQTVVLTIFMAGMALGSWLAAQWSPRIHRLLLAYAAVEAAVGGIGLVFHPAFVRAMDWSYASIFPALSSDAALHAFKWTLAGLSVLPQSILLGMTFPLMSAGLVRQCPQRPGETLALLYFANSLGAALGVLVSGFVLIRLVGLPGTMMTAALVNIVLACLVFLTVRGEPQPVVSAVPSHAPDTRAHRWFLGTAFLTGAASFMYEIGWIRMLSLVLGSSTHSFELMLSAFIFGLAFGGLWIRRRIESIKDPLSHVGYVMVVMGALALMTLPSYNWMFDFMAWALQTLATTEGGYAAFNASSQSIALMVMLPTTFCAGMTLPLLTHAFLQRAGSERAIGRLYAANTAGAIVGVLAGVHVLMPLAGTKGLIVTGAGIHMALGLSGLVASGGVRLTVRYRVAAGCAAALVAVGLFVNLDVLRMSSGVFRTGLAVQGGGTKVLYFQDGKTSTVSLLEQGGSIAIATNGKPDAAMNMGVGPPSTDEITMVLLGALPVGLHPHPERVANIGFGAGLTSHVVLGSDRVKHLDTIEIEPRMVEAARLAYFPRIRRALEDSRSKIVFDDAKTFFATARVPYDIIISEPSNPWVSGVATLFSDEFYARVTRYLRPDGYLVQWLQLYETDMTVVASVLKALRKHFPTYAIYSTDDTNVMIIAARSSEIPWNPVHMFDDPAVATELARVGVTSVGDIRQRYIGDQDTLDPLFQSYGVPANSDFFPFVDLNAPRLRYMNKAAVELTGLLALPVAVQTLLRNAGDNERGELSATGNLPRDSLTRESRLIRDALLHDRIEGLTPSATRDLMLLEMSAEQCQAREARDTWRRAAREISDATSAFLTHSDLTQIWERVRLLPCYAGYPGVHRQFADFYAAIAMQRIAEIATIGMTLITASEESLNDDERTLLLVATAAAQLQLGRNDQAVALLRAAAGGNYPRYYELTIRQLLALTEYRATKVAESGIGSPLTWASRN